MLALGLVLIAAAIGLVIWTVLSQVDEKATVRASLRQLDGRGTGGNPDDEQRNWKQMMQSEAPITEAERGAEPDAVPAHVRGKQVEERQETDGIDESAGDRQE